MRARHEEWWISLNVTRTRVTLLGFNLSMIAFQIGMLSAVYKHQTFTHHLPAMSALFIAFAFSIISGGCLLASQEFNREGLSRPWLFSIGDMLMYFALSQSVAGFTRKYMNVLQAAIKEIHTTFGAHEVGGFLVVTLTGMGLLSWIVTFYVGPWVSIYKSPVRQGQRRILVMMYLLIILAITLTATQAHRLQDVVLDDPEPTWQIFLWQFLQPLNWS